MNKSIPLNMSVEFVNVQAVNPLISSCDIKVLYHGKNRNKSFITKAVANEMAKTLPNIPIVGEYLEEMEDFGDHGQEMIINNKGVKFVRRTVPFGVVPSDTKIWWQTFVDEDGEQREYMMCNGYLWTGRYPETHRIIEKGNGQSMELDKDFMHGEWARLQNEDTEYFIVSEAVFSALCVLGEDVEPCFEGAQIGAPNMIYSLDKDDFKTQMSNFMLELKEALNQEGGEKEMELENLQNDGQSGVVDNAPIVNPIEDQEVETPEVEVPAIEPEQEAPVQEENEEPAQEEEKEETETPVEEPVEQPIENSYNLDEIEEYQTLKAEYSELKGKYDVLVAEKESMQTELHSLREVKNNVDRTEKESLIGNFYMLDEEDLKDVKENIDSYSLADIEAKLSIVAFRKKVNFNLDSEPVDTDDIVSFNAQSEESVPAWIKAIDKVKNNKR